MQPLPPFTKVNGIGGVYLMHTENPKHYVFISVYNDYWPISFQENSVLHLVL